MSPIRPTVTQEFKCLHSPYAHATTGCSLIGYRSGRFRAPNRGGVQHLDEAERVAATADVMNRRMSVRLVLLGR